MTNSDLWKLTTRLGRVVYVFVATLFVAGGVILLEVSSVNAIGATPSQISNFNNTVSAGKKEAYIITVDTTKGTDATKNKQLTLRALGSAGVRPNYSIYCDIASSTAATFVNQTANWVDYTCDYPTPGVYTIAVTGIYPGISTYNNSQDNPKKLISVDQWGVNKWRNLTEMFRAASNFNKIPDPAVEIPDTSLASDMRYTFHDATIFNQPIGSWDTSSVTSMRGLFANARAFNQPIGNWNTSKVTNMDGIFGYATAFNQPIESWDMSSVVIASKMFEGAAAFNQPLARWNLAKATTIGNMFARATSFNQPLEDWDISKISNVSYAFEAATAFNQPLGRWNLAKVNNMKGLLTRSGLSVANYDKTLAGWLSQVKAGNVGSTTMNLGADRLMYCDSDTRNALAALSWTIVGDSKSTVCQTATIKSDTFTIPENQTDVGTITLENNTSTITRYSLAAGQGDINNNLFTVDVNTGLLSFKSAPSPGTYSVRIQVSTDADLNPRIGYPPLQKALTVIVKDITPPMLIDGPTLSTSEQTNQDVVVEVVFSEPIDTGSLPAGWTAVPGKPNAFRKTYTENAVESVTFADLAGNSITVNVAVSNIDKTSGQQASNLPAVDKAVGKKKGLAATGDNAYGVVAVSVICVAAAAAWLIKRYS